MVPGPFRNGAAPFLSFAPGVLTWISEFEIRLLSCLLHPVAASLQASSAVRRSKNGFCESDERACERYFLLDFVKW
jgi:hypothetical protein